jgi:hypothetical protein
LSFFQFAELQQLKGLVLSWWFYSISQSEMLQGVRIDQVLHYENLEQELKELPFELPFTQLPRLESTEHRHWSDYYDSFTEQLIWDWALQDFEKYGYPRLLR